MNNLVPYFTLFLKAESWLQISLDDLWLESGLILGLSLLIFVFWKLFFGQIQKILPSIRKKEVSGSESDFVIPERGSRLIKIWKEYFSDKTLRRYFLFTLITCTILCVLTVKILVFNAHNEGKLLHDPLMLLLEPKDWSKVIFAFEYGAVIGMIFYVSDKPDYFIRCLLGVTVLMIARTATVLLIPLSPPESMVFLVDPFAQLFFGDNVQVNNDLFFSGHISLLALFYFATDNKLLKTYLLFTTLIVSFLLIWQHVHYTYDILFAPVVSYFIYKYIIAGQWVEKFSANPIWNWEIRSKS